MPLIRGESFHPGSNLVTYFPLVALEFVWIVNAKILHDTQQIKHIFSLHKCMGVTRFFTPHGFLIRGESLSSGLDLVKFSLS